jgi:hypothetical protein
MTPFQGLSGGVSPANQVTAHSRDPTMFPSIKMDLCPK